MTYLPRHDTQYEPRTTFSGRNCNMAAAADAARFWSLGLIDHNHQWFRDHAQEPDGSRDTSGGTNITQAAEVLGDAGIPSTIYDAADGKGIADVRAFVRAGSFVIAHGDYGSVPRYERGEIAPDFTGYHSVGFARHTAAGFQVGDGLSDAWEWWPDAIANAYMRDFPGGGYTFLVVRPRKLAAKVPKANVRTAMSTSAKVLGQITPSSRIHFGGIQRGGYVGANRSWYRVFYRGQIAYVHTSVAKPV